MLQILVFFSICGLVWIDAMPGTSTESKKYDIIDCYMPTELGVIRCRALVFVYRWDNNSKRCVLDNYGGCNGTKNNFSSKKECEKVARPVCQYLKEDNILDESSSERSS